MSPSRRDFLVAHHRELAALWGAAVAVDLLASHEYSSTHIVGASFLGLRALCAAWVFVDAGRRRIPGRFNWGAFCFMAWEFVFPLYLVRRSETGLSGLWEEGLAGLLAAIVFLPLHVQSIYRSYYPDTTPLVYEQNVFRGSRLHLWNHDGKLGLGGPGRHQSGSLSAVDWARRKADFQCPPGTVVVDAAPTELYCLKTVAPHSYVREGPSATLYSDGTTRCRAQYKDDQQEGMEECFFVEGKRAFQAGYKSGKLDGRARFFRENGSMISEVDFREGRPDGVRLLWDWKGKMLADDRYRDGVKIAAGSK